MPHHLMILYQLFCLHDLKCNVTLCFLCVFMCVYFSAFPVLFYEDLLVKLTKLDMS